MKQPIEELAAEKFNEHWLAWRYAFDPRDTNARRVVIEAFNEGIKLGMLRGFELVVKSLDK